ncbi:hypothetical protein HDV06_001265 [Boothiomyces sp. JEL0866]|nr:hypothetical protein HDV06_001265 [Boothiomyces sp. JEL0866]
MEKKIKLENSAVEVKEIATLSEEAVGITSYINQQSPGLTGIIKHRFDDFHVHEIDSKDNIVYLTTLKPPKSESSELPEKERIELLAKLISDDGFAPKLEEFLHSNAIKSISSPEITEKDQRTLVHQKIRELFPNIDSKTDGNTINFTFKKKGKNERINWKALGGEYLHFTLYKENRDTMDAINIISKLVKTDTKSFTYPGTKDKRAITSQRVSVKGITAERLSGINDKLNNIRLGNFSYHPESLQLGDANGNHFTIAIRNVEILDENALNEAINSLSKYGFINYFGMQRFGTRKIPTYHVGIAMLSEKWEKATELILAGDGDDDKEDIKLARKTFIEFKDAKKAAELMPRFCIAEKAILTSFSKQKGKINHFQAIQAIQRNMRTMYVHAYQSFVWNHIASKRFEMFGLNVVKGDLVMDKTKASTIDDNGKRSRRDVKVTVVDDPTKHSIYDVVLPLPGHSVVYPSSMVSEYEEIMKKNGFSPHNMARKVNEINLPGDYRHFVSLPKNVSGKVVKYSDSNDLKSLIASDLRKIEGDFEQDPEGDSVAYIVEFSLGTSQYATMALREILKSETGAGFQAIKSQDQRKRNIEQVE